MMSKGNTVPKNGKDSGKIHPYPELLRVDYQLKALKEDKPNSHLLQKLWETGDSPVRAAIATGAATPISLLERIANSEDEIEPIKELAKDNIHAFYYDF